MDIPAIIQSALRSSIAAFMQGVAAVTTVIVEACSEADNWGQGLYPIMQAHLRHIYGVAEEKDVPSIWREMALAWTKAEGLDLMSQFFLTGMSACKLEFHGNADLLHISLTLFNFVTKGAFTDHISHPACLSGGVYA